MAKKKYIKTSEARILVYLSQVNVQQRYTMKIAAKLDMDYGYLTKILNGMTAKGWISKEKGISTNKSFWKVNVEFLAEGRDIVELAKSSLGGIKKWTTQTISTWLKV